MGMTDKRAVYTMCALAASAILLAWISHASHKPEPRKDAPVPWVGTAPSQNATAATRQDSPSQVSASPRGSDDAQPSAPQPSPRPANQPAHPPDDASSAGSSTLPSFSTSLDGEEVAAPDSVASPQETAAQRVARHLRRH
jgi:hypothetical protein